MINLVLSVILGIIAVAAMGAGALVLLSTVGVVTYAIGWEYVAVIVIVVIVYSLFMEAVDRHCGEDE